MRRRLGIALLAAAAIPALALPAAAPGSPPPPALKSDNVEAITTLDEPQVISARFKKVGDEQFMFVSTLRGLAVRR